eukprot:2638954-Alexandrium_andersonii.AAC.1
MSHCPHLSSPQATAAPSSRSSAVWAPPGGDLGVGVAVPQSRELTLPRPIAPAGHRSAVGAEQHRVGCARGDL